MKRIYEIVSSIEFLQFQHIAREANKNFEILRPIIIVFICVINVALIDKH